MINTIPAGLGLVRDTYQSLLDGLVAQRVFWLQAPEQAQLPCIVVLSQDAGGDGVPFVGSVGWRGLITVRVFAVTRQAAESIAAQVVAAIPATVAASGVTITSQLVRPLVAPPAHQAYVAGFLYRVSVY